MLRDRLASVRELLAQGMTPFERRLHDRLIRETLRLFVAFQRSKSVPNDADSTGRSTTSHRDAKWQGVERRDVDNAAARQLLEFLGQQIQFQIRGLHVLAARHGEFRRTVSRAASRDERAQALLDYADELGTTWRGRWSDRRALRRWMDEEALIDRYRQRLGEQELMLIFLLDRFGSLIARLARPMKRSEDVAELWERLRVDPLVRAALDYNGDRRVRTAAMRCLCQSLEAIPPAAATLLVSQENTSRVHRLATDKTADVWLQCAAIDVLAKIDNQLFPSVVSRRLTRPLAGDDLFVRRHCLRRAVDLAAQLIDSDRLWDRVMQDPSPAVRQQLAATLWQYPGQAAWQRLQRLITLDAVPQVRAAAIHAALEAVDRPEFHLPFLRLLSERIVDEPDPFCQRVAMHVSVEWLKRWSERTHDERFQSQVQSMYEQRIVPAVAQVAAHDSSVPTRRWAAATAERLWVQLDPAVRDLYARIAARVASLRPGQTRLLPAKWLRDVDCDTFGRLLAVITQDDFGIEASRGVFGYLLTRQPHFGFRWWRVWHEFWRPATNKRQAYPHSIGRISQGTLRAPSRVMGERCATRVPGEPRVAESDGTWRPFLPLPDDFVSALNQSFLGPKTTRLYSSEGVTEIEVCRHPLRRLAAAVRLITRFGDMAEQRNWEATLSQRPDEYLQTMAREGFQVRFRPYDDHRHDASVTQFFPAIAPLGLSGGWWVLSDLAGKYAYYFDSAFPNTFTQLIVFTAAALLLFLARHGLSNWRIWRARRQIPLSVGGWGTRGKSSTERLKAALLCATGHGLVSKTTGCEASFIHAPPCGEPLEIPLYRPGGKATIWEQSNVLRMAAALRPSAFLWECMARTPDHVQVLQHQWMRDDLSTITNTYPDHEDVQGPSGRDVATTIAAFIPRRARLLTTEQQMLPLVRERCERLKTSLRGVTWLESGMITDDLLDRFPCREHPDNIALVTAMADELGYHHDFAIKAMADGLISDLGAPKTYPISYVQDCSLEFTRSKSAHELVDWRDNWKRLDVHGRDSQPASEAILSTVVHYRADRKTQSREFANILVNNLQADRYFLIGRNPKGFEGFIWESWKEYESSVSLRRETGEWDRAYALDVLQQLASRFRVPSSDEPLQAALRVMIEAVIARCEAGESGADRGRAADATVEGLFAELMSSPDQCEARLKELGADQADAARLAHHWRRMVQARNELLELNRLVGAARNTDEFHGAETQLRHTLREWFTRKLVVIDDDAAGDEIIQQIVDATPPGFLNRILGIQNSKTAGLDLVYRFHAWNTCHQACRMLAASDQATRARALAMLESLPDYGLLCQSLVSETCERLRQSPLPLPAVDQLQLASIVRKLDESAAASRQLRERQDGPSAASGHSWIRSICGTLEHWLNANDAVRRRHQADKIYRDLQSQRIGRRRAIEELRRLNQQQGGWLARRLLHRARSR